MYFDTWTNQIRYLLGEFRDGKSAVLLRSTGSEGRKARHEEMETREGHHVHGQLTQISVQLTWETEAGGDSWHGNLN
jgi:hypothetical protein